MLSERTSQRVLWENQHSTRGLRHECSDEMRLKPNDTAIAFNSYLRPHSRIIEVGSANGRDARYWATQGHSVYALDFAHTALKQLDQAAFEQGIQHSIVPIVWDANVGHLPINAQGSVDGFYARSALHVDDETMLRLAQNIDHLLTRGGTIMIEGKGSNDVKIGRSEIIPGGLARDNHENGHIRRIWTSDFAEMMCKNNNWRIVELNDTREEWRGIPASFMRLVAIKDK